jgi:hypothetical protein
LSHARCGLAIPVLLVSLAAAPAHAIDAGLVWNADLGVGFDANIGNSESSDDQRDAASLAVGAGASWERRFGSYTALQLSGGVAAEQVFELEDLSNAGGTVRARVRHKPGRGFYVPVLAAWTSLVGRDYGSPIRDSFTYRAGLSLTEPVTTAVQVRAEAVAARRDAKSRVFDLDGMAWSLSLDWAVSPRATVYGSFGMDDSPVVVSADGHGVTVPKSQHVYLASYADAIEADEAFGEDWWAFRIDARSTLLAAGVNLPLSPMMALDLQVRRGEARAGRYSYERLLGGVSVLMRW